MIIMESLNEFINESHPKKLNQDYTTDDKMRGIIEGFGIDVDDIYYDSLKDGIFKMAMEIYLSRGYKYTASGHVRSN